MSQTHVLPLVHMHRALGMPARITRPLYVFNLPACSNVSKVLAPVLTRNTCLCFF